MTISLSKPDAGSVGWAAAINQNFTDIETAINAGGGGASAPTGTIAMFGGGSAPTDWLLCDGTAVSRTTYAALYAVLGDAFGSGDGSTTFNLPDLRSRSPMGAGMGSGLSSRTIGNSLGEENHVLVTGEMPSHNHGVNDPGHAHNAVRFSSGTFTTSMFANAAIVTNGNFWTNVSGPVASNTTGITTQNEGSGSGHNTVHPCQVVNFIIKR